MTSSYKLTKRKIVGARVRYEFELGSLYSNSFKKIKTQRVFKCWF